jgi:S-DNA-T family DNA segregation ATPase FtsK/SpoIIIE
MKEERVIVLNWFQNLFQKLKKDDDDEFAEHNLHNHKMEFSAAANNQESAKDLDTKISYQYPKGNVLLNNVPPKVKTEIERPAHRITRKELRTERQKQEQVELEIIQVEKPRIKNEKPRVSRGPFQPTEIPSPVFGFNRPKPKDELIEHELSHFNKNPIIENPEPIFSKENVSRKEFIESALTMEEMIEDDIAAPALHTTVESHAAEDVIETNEQLAVFAEKLIQEQEMEPQVEKEPSEDRINIDQPIENGVVSQEETQEIQPKEQAAASKSHIPFNVMMLKQDKLMWEERKRGRHEEKVRPEPLKETTPVKEAAKTSEDHISLEINNDYQFPFNRLLKPPVFVGNDTEWLSSQEELLNVTLKNFNVGASVVNVTQGPSVTRFEVQPEPGVKVNKITNLSDDIKLSLAAKDIRIEAPIPGKHTIGIEVPNKISRPVLVNEIITSQVFQESSSPLTAVLGLDISGKPIVTDLKKMPHGLIAGATGSGKSVCINTILVSLLYKARPEEVKLLLIDPKMVELAPYNHIPHLVSPVITDVKAATAALKWAVDEMERRYELFAHTGVRDISRFNELAMEHKRYSDKLPFIVIVIDELADLMMMSPADVEEAICRIAQKARACGIHLIIATQRPSVDVITGLIKANIPTRIAFSVSSQIDSRTIIDIGGAEKLLGRGDMLFLENGSSKPVRLQGTFVSDEEIDLVVAHVREQREPDYLFQQEELLKKAQITEEEDELFYEACEFIVDQGGASTSSLQRRFKIGYNRAARLMDMLESQGLISGANGSKPREVLITEADLEMMQDGNGAG